MSIFTTAADLFEVRQPLLISDLIIFGKYYLTPILPPPGMENSVDNSEPPVTHFDEKDPEL